ncbi:MAG: hypothetical protein JJ911_03800 [Rhizobiaceae bacterium]|nr:hypothetical protein [Rhizobiaceae bacterium]
MRRAISTCLVIAAALPLAWPAQGADRYRLERAEGGFVRMDTETGKMSFCETGSGGLICTDVAGETSADAGRIAALESRVTELEERLAELDGGEAAHALPSDQEFEQTMTLMERFLRRFMGIVKEFETEAEQEPAPDRT